MSFGLNNKFLENNNFQMVSGYEVINTNKPLLVSKNIETYFDDLIKIPDVVQTAGKSESNFSKFYSEYIEHNILLLFIIFCLVIFLIIKYINKNYYDVENFTSTKNIKHKKIKNENDDEIDDYDDNDTFYSNKMKHKLKKQKLLKMKKDAERERHLLELEKQSILDIIDELSNINYEKIQSNNNKIVNDNVNYQNNYENFNTIHIDKDYLNENSQNYSNYSLIQSNEFTNDGFYTINRNINYKDKKSPNYIKGMYIESPFEE